jgi:uncharacterized protein
MKVDDDVVLDPVRVRSGDRNVVVTRLVGLVCVVALTAALVSAAVYDRVNPGRLKVDLSGQPIDTNLIDGEPECPPGPERLKIVDCRIAIFVTSINKYWAETLGTAWQPPTVVLYKTMVDTACGTYPTKTGPFYCPDDQTIYLDTGFFETLTNLGASTRPLTEGYVIAHEYGHHTQNLLGTNLPAIATELQADCLAGQWATHPTQNNIITDITTQDLEDANTAAAAVGDDNLGLTPDQFTHGTSKQRTNAFNQGQTQNCNPTTLL